MLNSVLDVDTVVSPDAYVPRQSSAISATGLAFVDDPSARSGVGRAFLREDGESRRVDVDCGTVGF